MAITRLPNVDFDKMIIESIEEVYAFDKADDELLFVFDQVKSGEITSESDVVYAEGRQGVQLAAFDRNKTAGFTCENGYVQAGAIAAQLGTDLAKGETAFEIMESASLTASNLTELALTNEATEVIGVYKLNKDGSKKSKLAEGDFTFSAGSDAVAAVAGDALAEDAPAADGVTYFTRTESSAGAGAHNDGTYAYTPAEVPETHPADTYFPLTNEGQDASGAVITLAAAGAAGDKYLVHYNSVTATGMTILNSGDKFSKNVKLVINMLGQESCSGAQYLMQCTFPNAKISGSFSLSAGDNPAVQNFEASALYDVCSESGELFTIKIV